MTHQTTDLPAHLKTPPLQGTSCHEPAMSLLTTLAVRPAIEIDHHVPEDGLTSVLGPMDSLADVTLHAANLRSRSGSDAEPVERRWHRNDNPAAEPSARDLAASRCLVGCITPESQQLGGLLDGERGPMLEVLEPEGSGSLDHVGPPRRFRPSPGVFPHRRGNLCLSKHQDYTLVIHLSRVVNSSAGCRL